MRIGAESLLEKYGSRFKLAVALIKGEVDGYDQQFAGDVLDTVILQAAKHHIELGLDKPTAKEKET